MIVDDIMSKTLLTVNVDDNLWTVKQLFKESGFHHLIVVQDDKLIGIVSDRDYLKAISPRIDTPTESAKDTETLNKTVQQIMTSNVITLKPNTDVYDAIDVFNNHKISCLPVVNQDKQPIGIISWRDILRVVAKTRKKPR
jgi:acetoin utilization protein AcuB